MKATTRVLVFSILIISFAAGLAFGAPGGQGAVKMNGHVVEMTKELPEEALKGPDAKDRNRKWIVQFAGPVYGHQKQELAVLGCEIGDYIPDFAFIVSMSNTMAREVAELPFVSGVARLKPEHKIDRNLKDYAEKFHVRIDREGSLPAVLSKVHRMKGKVLDVRKEVVRIETDWAGVHQLSRMEEVLWIEEAVPLELFNDTTKWVIQTYQYGDTKIWDHGIHGEGQIVGIGDTGLDYDMPWFIDPWFTPIGPMHRKVVGYDISYGDDYDGNFGHGTHVAGTVAGDRTPVDGLDNANGMAPKAKLFIQDLTPGEEGYVYPPSDLGSMFITTYGAGARIHTNSWGGAGNAYESAGRSLDSFVWNNRDFLVLFSNGNAGPGEGTVGRPATAKNVISVGATVNGDRAEDVAYFSSNGPTADGRIKPTVTAPGVDIVSADSDGQKNSFNAGTRTFSGTSMATPAVAGAAALVMQYFVDGFYPTGTANPADAFTPSAALVKGVLVNSAQEMTGAYTDSPIPSTGQGWGRVNLSNALVFSGDSKSLSVVDDAIGLQTGEDWSWAYYSYGDQPLKATLVWDDYPGTPGAEKALVNDLDLVVTGPGGTYRGNAFTDGESASGGVEDRLNVEEQVLIKNPPEGMYHVRINAFNVPYGPQPFALVVTGASELSHKGYVLLDRDRYNEASTVEIMVADLGPNMDSAVADTVDISLTSTTEDYGEAVTLVETDVNTSVFTGSMTLAPAVYKNPAKGWEGEPGNGYLEVAEGDTITAIYNDADDGTGAPAVATYTAVADNTPPVITSVSAGDIGETYATVSWGTDETSGSEVNYGETAALGMSAFEPGLVTQHSVTLKNLEEAKTYYYEVRSTDEAGNPAVDDNGGSLYTFALVNVPPELTVNSSNGLETYEADTVIYGTALDSSGVASVTINGTPVTLRPEDGYYELAASLDAGGNTFTVVATDTLGNAREKTITVTRFLKAELAVTAVSGPAGALTAETITVSTTVSNNGPGDAGYFQVGIYLSTDEVITTSDTRVGIYSVNGLAAGATHSTDKAVIIYSRFATGTYYVGAIADYDGRVVETDEANNALAGNQIEITAPDLYMTSVSAPSSASTGEDITVTYTVTASPNGGGANSFSVGIYFSGEDVITTSDTKIGFDHVAGLAPGESVTGSITATVPSTVASGYIGAIADYMEDVVESDETNNGLAGNQVIINSPDLIMAAVSGPATGLTGKPITINSTVTADATGGEVTTGISVGFYLSADSIITTGDHLIGGRYIPSIAAGESSTADTQINLPSNFGTGTYYLGAIVDYSNMVAESDETNNALAGGQFTLIGPDLYVSSVNYPANAYGGETITVSDTVTASAAGSDAGEFYVGIFLSQDSVITPDDILLGYRYIGGLAAGASSSADTQITLPAPTSYTGPRYIGVIADNFPLEPCFMCWYENEVAESDETNNALAGELINIAGPDLVMTEVSGPESGFAGGPITVRSTVSTLAGGTVFDVSVGLYLSTDNVITRSDVCMGSGTVSALAPLGSSTADIEVTIPFGMAGSPGTYYIGAIADWNEFFAEDDETNNTLAGGQFTLIGPDLAMVSLDGPTSALTGDTITVSDTVTTTAGGAEVFRVGFYLSTDSVIDSSDRYLWSRRVDLLAPGESSSGETTFTIPSNISGIYYLGAIADYQNGYSEPNEEDNILAYQITITGPDLYMTAVSGPTSAEGGGSITVSDTVSAGAVGSTVPASFSVGFYLSTDNVITTSDALMGYRTVSSLAPGASSSADTTVTVPAGLAAGMYYIGAIADYQESWYEPDEANNALAGNQIAITSPDLMVTAVSGPASGHPGFIITISHTLAASAAHGDAPVSTTGFYLSTDNVITTSDILIGSRSEPALAAGESVSSGTQVTIPTGTALGTYYIGAVADYAGSMNEPDEANNALAGNEITVSAMPPPDLLMTYVSYPGSAPRGSAVTVSNTVKNNGAAVSGNGFYVTFYLSTDPVDTPDDRMLGYRYIGSLGAGASNFANTVITIPSDVAPGTYYIIAYADDCSWDEYCDSWVDGESNENNNDMAGGPIEITLP